MGEHMPERIEVHGAGKPGVDYIEVPTPNESYLEALQVERAGYQLRLDAGETERGGEQIADIMARNAAEIVRVGGRIPHASFIGATVPVMVGEQGPELERQRFETTPDQPPFPGWVRDRETGDWRAPRPKGRPRKDDA
jgi:hypothetical protein